MPPLAHARRALPLALAAVCFAAPSFAQSAQPASPPAPAAPTPAADVAAPAPPPPTPSWETPPPLPEGTRVPRRAPPVYDVERVERPAPVQRECPDPQRAGRVVAETLAGSVSTAGAVFIGMFAQDSSSTGGVILGTLGALLMHITVTPAAIGLAGRSVGGNGRYWAALVGNILVPVAGGVLGYELSHDPICDDDAPRPTARATRRAPPTPVPLRVAPVVAPNLAGPGGATAGVALMF